MRAFLFPGQGSQYVGMGQELVREFPIAREVFRWADDHLDFSLSELCFRGPEAELRLTENTQPAILTVSIAVLRVLEERGERADWVAGHSLGEYSALVCAGGLDFGDALRLVRSRGRFMQEAVPVGVGAMAAILGMEADRVAVLCRELSREETVSIANRNSPQQVVVAGHKAAVGRLCERLREEGARRVIPLSVSAPFHCELMKPAQDAMRPLLEETEFRDLEIPLVNNVTGRKVVSGAAAREGLIRQITSEVKWTESLRSLFEAGVGEFLEVGPGKVLKGLVRSTLDDVKVESVEKPEQVNEYVQT